MSSESVEVLLFHANCQDGWCCAWQIKKAFPDCELVPVNYGDGLPGEGLYDGKRVVIADFSYPPDQMAVICAKAKSVVMLDHHRSAIRKWDGEETYPNDVGEVISPNSLMRWGRCDNVAFRFDESKSGAMLVWEWLHPDRTVLDCPWLVRYVESRDLWRWDLPFDREINAYIASRPKTVEAWDRLMDEFEDQPRRYQAVQCGEAILSANDRYLDAIVHRAVYWPVGPYRTVPVVNTTHLHSEVGERLSRGMPFSVTCSDDLASGVRRWSFRSSKGGLDVSRIAEELGGGGHAPAAGAERRIDEPMSVVAGIVASAAGKQLVNSASEVK